MLADFSRKLAANRLMPTVTGVQRQVSRFNLTLPTQPAHNSAYEDPGDFSSCLKILTALDHIEHLAAFLFAKHDVALFPVSRIHLGHSLAFLAVIFWVLQIFTGFILLGLLAYVLELQFPDLLNVVFHGNYA